MSEPTLQMILEKLQKIEEAVTHIEATVCMSQLEKNRILAQEKGLSGMTHF